jgi:hypothetical protein
MTGEHIAGLCSAALGALGTAILFFKSYSLQPSEGAVWGSDAVTAANARIKASNVSRLRWQRWGVAILGSSFVAQAIGCFL